MTTRTQHGTLLLADLSGFTSFLATTELEHAHHILLELLQLVVERLRSTLTIIEIEGDAVFAYAPDGTLPTGPALLELVEHTYAAFLGRVEAIRMHTTCGCSACRAIPILDLKFIVHHGEYILQAVTGTPKPLGSDVNLVHRLLKNRVGETTGWKAYALLTAPAVQSLGLPTEGMHEQVETFPDLPEVRTYSLDLRSRLQELQRLRGAVVTERDADAVFRVDLPAPPAVVWDWLNDPQRRTLWLGLHVDAIASAGGRRGVGTKTHCTHGTKVESIHTILDWRPLESFTEEIASPKDDRPEALNTISLEPIDGGTRVTSRYRILVSPA